MEADLNSARRTTGVDGNHILYHYLEKDLREKDIWLFQMLAARLFTSLGIWFSPTLYARLPVLLPFAVRDPTCRPRKKGQVDQWGAPSEAGYFRDDNSLVKGLPRSLTIEASQNPAYNGRTISNGFVAAHVWRRLKALANAPQLAARDPITNTFIPNLVWLPAQVAKLTDREGSFAQSYLQALAIKIYRDIPVANSLKRIAEEAWDKLPTPTGIPMNGLPNPKELAYFAETDTYISRRVRTIATVHKALESRTSSATAMGMVVSSRYSEGLRKIKSTDVKDLRDLLSSFLTEEDDAAATS